MKFYTKKLQIKINLEHNNFIEIEILQINLAIGSFIIPNYLPMRFLDY